MLENSVAFVSVSRNRALVRTRPAAYERGLHLARGTEAFALTPSSRDRSSCNPLKIRAREVVGALVAPDSDPDWTVAGAANYRIRILDRQQPVTVMLDDGFELPDGAAQLTFSVLAASHRTVSSITVELLDAAGQMVGSETEQLVLDQHGGRDRSGYQKLTLRLPIPEGAATGRVRLLHHETHMPDAPYDPFIFLVDPVVLTESSDELSLSSILYLGVDHPEMQWYEATVPLLRAGAAPLELVLNQERKVLTASSRARIQLVQDQGHALSLQADRVTDARVVIGNHPGYVVRIEPHETWLRLPEAVLTGEPVKFELHDLQQGNILFETWLIPPRVLTPVDVLQRESRTPFDARLFVQSADRYRALRAHMAAGSPAEVMSQLPTALDALDAGYEGLQMRPLSFPEVAKPKVSVIIPAHNKVEVTYSCLCALLLAWNKASFEVILVDDASTDATATIEELVSGLTVLRNSEAQRFIRACNAGVAASRGEFVVLLNNDTEPTTGWLDQLLAAFDRFDNVGLAGAKLVYPDGRLQDAGGIIWGSGNPWNYGYRQNAADPRFNYARQADYLSGAALMMPRRVWDQVGGLSQYLEPMYFEDTDLSFKVREAGFATWYVPGALVYHYEGMTSGTSTASGFKRYQEVNRPKFKRRWARDYASHGREGELPDLEKDRGIIGRVLFVDYMLPRGDQDAGSYAALQEIRLVQSLGYKVTFLPENMADLGCYTQELQAMGVEVITAPFYLSVKEFLDSRGREFDAFYITRYHVAENVVPAIRQVNPAARILLNNADLHFLRTMRTALALKDPEAMAGVDALRDRELAAMRSVDVVLSYNDVEHAVIQSHTNGAVQVARCPWVVEPAAKSPPRKTRKGLSFLGSYRHHPNEEGVLWFQSEVMPLLRNQGQAAHLSLYGAGMTPRIKALASDLVDTCGFVETVDMAFDPHLICIAPLLSGAGIKGKVLSALAHGIPTVLTPVAAEGIGLRHGHDCMIATTPAEWADAIRRLLEDAKLWQSVSDNAMALIKDNYSFTKGRENMRLAFEAVELYGMRE